MIADGVDVDLTPIRPAIRDLCDMLRSMPKHDAAEWLTRRAGAAKGSRDMPRGPGE